jgi:hypothetical protein
MRRKRRTPGQKWRGKPRQMDQHFNPENGIYSRKGAKAAKKFKSL